MRKIIRKREVSSAALVVALSAGCGARQPNAVSAPKVILAAQGESAASVAPDQAWAKLVEGNSTSGGKAPQHVSALVEKIAAAVDAVKAGGGDVLAHAVDENVERMVEALQTSQPMLGKMVTEGKLRVIGARYDLDAGEVHTVERKGSSDRLK